MTGALAYPIFGGVGDTPEIQRIRSIHFGVSDFMDVRVGILESEFIK